MIFSVQSQAKQTVLPTAQLGQFCLLSLSFCGDYAITDAVAAPSGASMAEIQNITVGLFSCHTQQLATHSEID